MSENWEKWKAECRRLPWLDLMQHAGVSLDNEHLCAECFYCAAVTVLQEQLTTLLRS